MNKVIYFVHDEPMAAVKIGKADEIARRMKSLQCASSATLILLGTVPYVPGLEAALHRRYSDKRIRGEWFRLTVEEAMEIISTLSEAGAEQIREVLHPKSCDNSGLGVMVRGERLIKVIQPKPVKVKLPIGRPALPDGQRRDKWLNDVRFSRAELARLKGIAEAAGVRWSDWVRGRLGL